RVRFRVGEHVSSRSRERADRDGIRAQPESQRLQRQHAGRGDIADVDVGTELADEPGLLALARRLEDHLVGRDPGQDGRDQILAYSLVRVVEADGAALPALGYHPAGARVEVAGHLLAPLRWGRRVVAFLGAGFREHY